MFFGLIKPFDELKLKKYYLRSYWVNNRVLKQANLLFLNFIKTESDALQLCCLKYG